MSGRTLAGRGLDLFNLANDDACFASDEPGASTPAKPVWWEDPFADAAGFRDSKDSAPRYVYDAFSQPVRSKKEAAHLHWQELTGATHFLGASRRATASQRAARRSGRRKRPSGATKRSPARRRDQPRRGSVLMEQTPIEAHRRTHLIQSHWHLFCGFGIAPVLHP